MKHNSRIIEWFWYEYSLLVSLQAVLEPAGTSQNHSTQRKYLSKLDDLPNTVMLLEITMDNSQTAAILNTTSLLVVVWRVLSGFLMPRYLPRLMKVMCMILALQARTSHVTYTLHHMTPNGQYPATATVMSIKLCRWIAFVEPVSSLVFIAFIVLFVLVVLVVLVRLNGRISLASGSLNWTDVARSSMRRAKGQGKAYVEILEMKLVSSSFPGHLLLSLCESYEWIITGVEVNLATNRRVVIMHANFAFGHDYKVLLIIENRD